MDWLALAIGNSRLHWAWFQGENIQQTWHTRHLTRSILQENAIAQGLPPSLSNKLFDLPIYLASVVPEQTVLWQNYPHLKIITLARIPLENVYPTMGIDRALAVWGAAIAYGFPCLVIDAGTALTFTGVNSEKKLVGGAILPGLNLQLQMLAKQTAALPLVELPDSLPERWNLDTSGAIRSGIIYTLLAGIYDFIEAWNRQFPLSKIVLTGGDATQLNHYLQTRYSNIGERIIIEPHLIFLGMRSLVSIIGDR